VAVCSDSARAGGSHPKPIAGSSAINEQLKAGYGRPRRTVVGQERPSNQTRRGTIERQQRACEATLTIDARPVRHLRKTRGSSLAGGAGLVPMIAHTKIV
jgi:hypothetical protein